MASARKTDGSTSSNNENIYKVIVIGDSSVGKTTLTYRWCEGRFLDHSNLTIGVDIRSKTLMIDGENITLQLWDTAGQERHRLSMMGNYYRNTDGVVLVYDVTNRRSFASLNKWLEESNMNCMPDVPKILIGNKYDETMAVPTNDAQRFAEMHNMPLFETSARLDSECDTVNKIFLTLAHKIKNQRRLRYPPTNDPLRITGCIVKDNTDKEKSWCC